MSTSIDWLTHTPCAHRGLHDDHLPENSLGAFSAAIAQGYGIELDVRQLADGSLVVFHDSDLLRMTGQAGALGLMRYSDLHNLRLANSDYAIPSLAQVLELVAGRVPLLIEIKNDQANGALENILAKLLDCYQGAFAVQSFNIPSVQWFAIHRPDFLRGRLAGNFEDLTHLPFYRRFSLSSGLFFNIGKPHFLAYNIRALNRLALYWLRWITRLPIITWTVRTIAQRDFCQRHGINIIFEKITPRR